MKKNITKYPLLVSSVKSNVYSSIVGWIGILFILISLVIAFVGTSQYSYIGNFDFEDYIEQAFNTRPGASLIDDAFKGCFIIGIILFAFSFIAMFVGSITAISYSKRIKEEYDESILGLSFINCFLGIFTSLMLKKKVFNILSDDSLNEQEELDVQTNENRFEKNNNEQATQNFVKNVTKNSITTTSETTYKEQFNGGERIVTTKEVDVNFENIRSKIENINKLKKEGLINEYEYYELREKILAID